MKKKDKKTELISVDWIQLKFRVPIAVREKLQEEAEVLGKTQDAYFLALWDLHDESYRKLLTQKHLEIKTKLSKK